MNLESAKAKEFTWSKGVYLSEGIGYLASTNPEMKENWPTSNIKTMMKRSATSLAGNVKIFKLINYFRQLSKKRSTIGAYPDTGSESAEDKYRKTFFVPILSSEDINKISPLLKLKFFCRREISKSVQIRLLPEKWGHLEGQKEFKVGGKNVEPFASSLGVCIGFHLRSYGHLLANTKVEQIMEQLQDIEKVLTLENKIEFGEL